MALRSTQYLTERSTRDISWGVGGRCLGLTSLPPSCTDCLQSSSRILVLGRYLSNADRVDWEFVWRGYDFATIHATELSKCCGGRCIWDWCFSLKCRTIKQFVASYPAPPFSFVLRHLLTPQVSFFATASPRKFRSSPPPHPASFVLHHHLTPPVSR
jgi:hypothetical protein